MYIEHFIFLVGAPRVMQEVTKAALSFPVPLALSGLVSFAPFAVFDALTPGSGENGNGRREIIYR
ncbi:MULTISPECIES: hypothetical protein [unclassified Marinovum]